MTPSTITCFLATQHCSDMLGLQKAMALQEGAPRRHLQSPAAERFEVRSRPCPEPLSLEQSTMGRFVADAQVLWEWSAVWRCTQLFEFVSA